jgi:cysteine-rich CPCC protein
MNRSRDAAPLAFVREAETDCPVCGLGDAFGAAQHYDVCARCGWVDDPAAYADSERKSETNDDSLGEAKRSWPKRLALRLAEAPCSTFGVTRRHDEIGGYDYLIDGISVRELFPAGVWDLKASIGPWATPGDWLAPLKSGVPNTPTRRSRLYVCHLCGGDDYEACLSADLKVGAERVIWSRIGLETYGYSPEGWKLDVRRGPAGFAFEAEQYRHVLADAQLLSHGVRRPTC